MFMDRNRKLNGAADPGATASSEAGEQRRAQKLSPNEYPQNGEDWRFQPSLETCAQINENHYMAGLKDGGPYDKSYEDKIPFVGNEVPRGTDRKLKSR